MKKITLAILAVTALAFSSVAQSNYNVVAPPNQGATSSLRAPNGTSVHAVQRTVMFLNEEELVPMNIATFTNIAFQYLNGTGSNAVAGTMTLMLSNTNDFQYAKGGNYNTAVAGMSTVYVGPFTVPAASGSATVPLALTSAFNYTGGGLYVAWDFVTAGPFATAAASLASCSQFNNKFDNNTTLQAYTWLGSSESTVSPAPTATALGGSFFRPSLIFSGVNTATTEVEILSMNARGKTAKLFGTPEEITTRVVNSSIGALTNVTVALNITGANPFVTTQVIPSLAAGATTMLTWSSYTPTATGISTITAAVLLADQNPSNNSLSFLQNVTCGSLSNLPANSVYDSGYGFNSTSGGIFAVKQRIPANCMLSTIAMPTFSSSSATAPMYGVLIDVATNNILASSSNTPNGVPNSTMTFNFNPPVNLSAGTDYYIGVATGISAATSFAYAYTANDNYVVPPVYQFPLAAGSAPGELDDNIYMTMEAGLTFTSVGITASASKTLVCKTSPQQVTLTATGANTYSWSVAGLGTGGQVIYTPTVATNANQVIVTVSGNYTTGPAAGCKSASSSLTFSLAACLGVTENTGENAIKVMPNPAVSGKTTISNLSGVNTINVFNTLGQIVITRVSSNETESIDLSNFPSGNYLIRITDSSNETRTVKLVNQN